MASRFWSSCAKTPLRLPFPSSCSRQFPDRWPDSTLSKPAPANLSPTPSAPNDSSPPPKRWLPLLPFRHPKRYHALTLPPPFRNLPVTSLSQARHCPKTAPVLSQWPVRPKILVVDDEPEAVELVEFNLKQAGYDVVTAADGAEALQKARAVLPGLILLDLMLPELDGLAVCKMLRRDPATSAIPFIMVTAKAAEIDRILGLELGADDYITKPFSPRALVLRVKKMLQRGQAADDKKDTFQMGVLLIDVPRHLVTVQGKRVNLTATEFKLLTVLPQRRDRLQ